MIELRPQWCLDDSDVAKSVKFGPWLDADGNDVFSLNGDDWRPGDVVRVQRSISVDGDAIELRRALGLPTGLRVSVGVRWFCRATGRAGVHEQGPAPLTLLEANLLEVALPREIARTVELETCLIGFWDAGQERNDLCPNGALMWSDGWEAPPSDREILLEGSQLRIPVSTVSFKERFEGTSSALWFIELDVGIEPDHLVSNAVGVLLNADVLERDFKSSAGEADASLLSGTIIAGIQVDLFRMLTGTLKEQLAEVGEWEECGDGAVGPLVRDRLLQSFDSLETALATFDESQPDFTKRLWDSFAPNSWKS